MESQLKMSETEVPYSRSCHWLWYAFRSFQGSNFHPFSFHFIFQQSFSMTCENCIFNINFHLYHYPLDIMISKMFFFWPIHAYFLKNPFYFHFQKSDWPSNKVLRNIINFCPVQNAIYWYEEKCLHNTTFCWKVIFQQFFTKQHFLQTTQFQSNDVLVFLFSFWPRKSYTQ